LAQAPSPAPPDYGALSVLEGAWEATTVSMGVGAAGAVSHARIVNQCARVGRNYACQQVVNGKVGAMIVFVPQPAAGRWWTGYVSPGGEGQRGRGELTIAGPVWTYATGTAGETLTRNTNTYAGRDRIHFEIETSTDGGKTWVLGMSGDEVRVAGVSSG
jgi:hypothetical protein